MSGHSKWATTKHKKAVVDARRGKLFAKLIKNVEVAARTGGGDPAGNPTLADAIAKAKGNSVPNDNIDRAVRRGVRQGWHPVTDVADRPWASSPSTADRRPSAFRTDNPNQTGESWLGQRITRDPGQAGEEEGNP